MPIGPSQSNIKKDLWINYLENEASPQELAVEVGDLSCKKAPYELKNPKQDDCHVFIKVTDGKVEERVRFNRDGDQFILDTKTNSAKALKWFYQEHSQESIDRVFGSLGIMGNFLIAKGNEQARLTDLSFLAQLGVSFADFILRGNAKTIKTGQVKSGEEFLAFLLATYVSSPKFFEKEFRPILGTLATLPAELENDEAKARVQQLLDLKSYQSNDEELIKFLFIQGLKDDAEMLEEEEVSELRLKYYENKMTNRQEEELDNRLENLETFVAQLVLYEKMGLAFPKKKVLMQAAVAFHELTGENLCTALEEFNQEGSFKLDEATVQKCRNVTRVTKPVLTKVPENQASPLPTKPLNGDKVWRNTEIGLGAGGVALLGGGVPLLLQRSRGLKITGVALSSVGASAAGCSLGSLVRLASPWRQKARQQNIAGAVGCGVGGVLAGSAMAVMGGLIIGPKDASPANMMPPQGDPGQKNPIDEGGP